MLARRGHFRAELERKLADRGHPADEIAAALDKLRRLGFLDDEELTKREAERLRRSRGLGRAALGTELRRKGAPASAVDALLSAVPAEEEEERARSVAERWLRGHRTDAAALGRHLDRKGYPASVIRRVLGELEPSGAEAPPDD